MSELPPYPAKLYRALHTGNPGDIAFYRRACAGAKSVLELGCGDARVLTGLDPQSHERIVGLELHPGLLEYARRAAARRPAETTPIELVEADMQAPPVELGRFERVIVPHGGLYCLLEVDELGRCLRAAHKLLHPGGQFIFDVWAADDFHESYDPEDQEDTWMDHHGRFEIEGETWEIVERSQWRPHEQRMDVTYVHVKVGEMDATECLLPQRYFLRQEIETLLTEAGFSAVDLRGDFADSPYGEESELLVVTATA